MISNTSRQFLVAEAKKSADKVKTLTAELAAMVKRRDSLNADIEEVKRQLSIIKDSIIEMKKDIGV
jgi:uncharacterized coiled-coil DUF342 family protein